ncbi:hypothetical protein HOY82DRAFT_671066 [Tuber indicum]|nr:hypothetical protein HOY82DRAFT_671066 [Tuber indicum]
MASLSIENISRIKQRGVVVVGNVVPEEHALAMKELLKDQIKRNQWAKDFPADSPAV